MLGGWKFSNYKDGVFADFFHVNDADGNLAHLPEGMDPVDACIMSDMVPTGFHAVEQADVQFGDTVLVIGIGPVGLMAVRACALRGASRIMAVGTRPVCMEVAKAYGADEFITLQGWPHLCTGLGTDKWRRCGPRLHCRRQRGYLQRSHQVPEARRTDWQR